MVPGDLMGSPIVVFFAVPGGMVGLSSRSDMERLQMNLYLHEEKGLGGLREAGLLRRQAGHVTLWAHSGELVWVRGDQADGI